MRMSRNSEQTPMGEARGEHDPEGHDPQQGLLVQPDQIPKQVVQQLPRETQRNKETVSQPGLSGGRCLVSAPDPLASARCTLASALDSLASACCPLAPHAAP
eukprot:651238-Pyramimonas_sp.AAC.2